MNAAQTEALAHFDAFYPEFDQALDEEDGERIAALVDERTHAIDRLVSAFEGSFLPEAVRLHIEGTEVIVHTRLVRYYDSIVLRLAEERRRSYAAGRYQEEAR